MHLYQNARRWELIDRNPIDLVRQSSRRVRIPRVLTAEEIRSLLVQLAEPYHTMVLVAACTGLRVFPRNDIVFDMNFTVRRKAEIASIVVHSSGTD
jgi:integrase